MTTDILNLNQQVSSNNNTQRHENHHHHHQNQHQHQHQHHFDINNGYNQVPQGSQISQEPYSFANKLNSKICCTNTKKNHNNNNKTEMSKTNGSKVNHSKSSTTTATTTATTTTCTSDTSNTEVITDLNGNVISIPNMNNNNNNNNNGNGNDHTELNSINRNSNETNEMANNTQTGMKSVVDSGPSNSSNASKTIDRISEEDVKNMNKETNTGNAFQMKKRKNDEKVDMDDDSYNSKLTNSNTKRKKTEEFLYEEDNVHTSQLKKESRKTIDSPIDNYSYAYSNVHRNNAVTPTYSVEIMDHNRSNSSELTNSYMNHSSSDFNTSSQQVQSNSQRSSPQKSIGQNPVYVPQNFPQRIPNFNETPNNMSFNYLPATSNNYPPPHVPALNFPTAPLNSKNSNNRSYMPVNNQMMWMNMPEHSQYHQFSNVHFPQNGQQHQQNQQNDNQNYMPYPMAFNSFPRNTNGPMTGNMYNQNGMMKNTPNLHPNKSSNSNGNGASMHSMQIGQSGVSQMSQYMDPTLFSNNYHGLDSSNSQEIPPNMMFHNTMVSSQDQTRMTNHPQIQFQNRSESLYSVGKNNANHNVIHHGIARLDNDYERDGILGNASSINSKNKIYRQDNDIENAGNADNDARSEITDGHGLVAQESSSGISGEIEKRLGKYDNSGTKKRQIRRRNPKKPKFWSAEEDDLLTNAVKKYDGKRWKLIAEEVPGRSHVQCLQRWNKVLRPGLKKGCWSPDEDKKLLDLISYFSDQPDWVFIASKIEGRSPKQCRERWAFNLDPKIKKNNWTKEEDNIILQSQAELGNRWAQISTLLPGRTENAIKIRFKSLFRAKKRKWTKAEDETLLRLYESHNNDYAHISTFFSNRSKHAIKLRIRTLLGKAIDGSAYQYDSEESSQQS